jgi:hypothetical protein
MGRQRCLSTAALAALVALATALGGCAGKGSTSPTDTMPPEAMDAAGRAALPEGFPIEVPVAEGMVSAAEVTGDVSGGPWWVLVATPGEAAAVASWYREAFAARSWTLQQDETNADGRFLAFVKGAGAWATVQIDGTDAGSSVELWLGLGVPVPAEALPEGETPSSS